MRAAPGITPTSRCTSLKRRHLQPPKQRPPLPPRLPRPWRQPRRHRAFRTGAAIDPWFTAKETGTYPLVLTFYSFLPNDTHDCKKKLHGFQIVQDASKCQFFWNNKEDFSGPYNLQWSNSQFKWLSGRTLWDPCIFFYTRVFDL